MAVYDLDGNVISETNDIFIKALKEKYPSYNDDQLLDIAIELSQASGKTAIIIWDGEDIHFSGQITHTCMGFGGIDFNGSKIYMPDYVGDPIINIVPDTTTDITAQYSDFSDSYTTNVSLKGKVFRMNDALTGNADMCLGYRYGNSSESVLYIAPTIKTSQEGRFETGDLYMVPTSGTVECYNVHEYPSERFTVCNATVITSATNKATVLVECTRSNTHIHNFVLQGQSETTDFYWGIFVFKACSDIEVDHISGIAPVKRTYTSGYFLALLSTAFSYVHDVFVGDSTSWGAVGCRFLTNSTFERCYLNRWDCHFAQFGNNVARECVFNTIVYGLGNGTLLFDNCTVIQNDTSNSVLTMINTRPDCPGVFDGIIRVKDCKFINRLQPENLITIWFDGCTYSKPSNSDVTGSPKKERIIEGCQFPNGVHSILKIGTETSADQGMFENLKYKIKDCNIDCVNAVAFGNGSGNEVKEIAVDGCSVSGDTVKGLVCNLKVAGCELENITSNIAIPNLVATGNVFSGAQSVNNFTAYALSGNIASDMASVNKHSN